MKLLVKIPNKPMKIFIASILSAFVIAIFTSVIVKDIIMNQNCTGYLKRAADANTPEMALVELKKAIQYLEENEITDGYTSVFWKTPDEDIRFWYQNIKASESELMKIDSTTPSMERTNLLMKLRETLMDGSDNGDSITFPPGLSRYPNNALWGVMMVLSVIIVIGLIIWIFIIEW